MSEREQYLHELMEALEGVSADCRTEILKEVETHLSDLESDGGEISAEMGASTHLANSLKQLHQPRRWADFAIAIAPTLLLLPLSFLLYRFFQPETNNWQPLFAVRAWLLLALAGFIGGMSLRRAALDLRLIAFVYVLGVSISTLVWRSPLLMGDTYVSNAHAIVATITLATAIWQLTAAFKRARQDPLLFTLGIVAVLQLAVSPIANILISRTVGASDMGTIAQLSAIVLPIVLVTAYGFIILSQQSHLRWLGILLLAIGAQLPISLAYLRHEPMGLAAVLSLLVLPVGIVATGWIRERRNLFVPIQ